MPASIRTTLHSSPGGPVVGPVLVDQSRNDLHKGYQVVLESVNVHSTYAWSIVFKPESPNRTDSTAGLLAPEGSTSSTAKFNVDFEGAYLIRLVVDAGLPTESTTFVRLRFKTRFGNLNLVAAGERRDENGVIPVDATPEGWSNDQNQNLQLLLAQVRRQATSGRIFWVDANRGRDDGDNANDPAVTYELPGADPAATEDEVTFTAEGHGDFSTINEAISYAMAAAARGEPAPSTTSPYIIYVKPGLYVEDLNLQANVHIIGDAPLVEPDVSDDGPGPVVIRAANAGGNTHAFEPSGDGDEVNLVNLTLVNTAVTAEPVLRHRRGVLTMIRCKVLQQANGAGQGPCILTEITAPGAVADLHLYNSWLSSEATADDDRYALVFDSPGELYLRSSILEGRSCLALNPSLYGSVEAELDGTEVVAEDGYGIRAGGGFESRQSSVNSNSPDKNIVIDGFGAVPGSLPGDLVVVLAFCRVGRVIIHRNFVAGDTILRTGGVVTGDDPASQDSWLRTPEGALTEISGDLTARTLLYHTNWRLPEDQPAGPETVPGNSKFPYRNVQDVLDLLANITNPLGSALGVGPYPGGLTLNAAYNGLSSYNPFTVGAGLGRAINASPGAVQIFGDPSPGTPNIDPTLPGGLQVSSVIDIGPIQGDGLGSEIFLQANSFGLGPMIDLGRNVWHNEIFDPPRALPAGFVRAGWHTGGGAPPGGVTGYSLWLMTLSGVHSASGEFGRLILSAGRMVNAGASDALGGPVFLEAGDIQRVGSLGEPGSVWVVPGWSANGGIDHGRLRLVRPSAATPATLRSVNPTGPMNRDGQLHLATPDMTHTTGGVFVNLTNGMNLAAIIAAINNDLAGEIVASDDAGHLLLTASKRGINSELVVLGAGQISAGTENDFFNDLGELRPSVGATYTKGTYPEYVDLECTANGELTVHGVIAGVGGGGGAPVDDYAQWVIPGGGPFTYTITTESLIGVDSTASGGDVFLPNPQPAVGTNITVKLEAGGNPVNLDGNGSNIDGAASTPIAILYESVTVYWNGTQWFTK